MWKCELEKAEGGGEGARCWTSVPEGCGTDSTGFSSQRACHSAASQMEEEDSEV